MKKKSFATKKDPLLTKKKKNLSWQRGQWLERRDCNRHCLGSKPTRTILLCPLERHFAALSLAWWS